MLDVTETMCLCMVAAQIMAEGDSARLSLTFMYPGCALLASLIAFFAVRCSDQGAYISDRHISSCWGFRFGLYGTHVLVALFTLIMTGAVYGNYPFDVLREGNYRKTEGWPFFGVHLVGQCGSILLWEMTSFFTSHRWFPTRSVTAAGITGPATMLVQGLGVAMISCIPPMVILGGVVLIAHASAGQFGVAIAALGFWSPAGFVAAANAVAPAVFGADDCLDHPETQDHRQRTVPLVMAGESQSAEYRGWSVVAAMLSSFAVLCAFKQESGMATGGIGEPFMTQGPNKAGFSMGTYRDVMPTGERGSIRALESEVILEGFVASWAMTGGFSTILIAGISTLAIGKATRNLVDETRAQLNRDGAADPEGISGAVTFPAIAGSMLPAFYIVLFPVCVGFFAGPRALGAFSVGAILAAGPFATVLFNAGASWAKSKTAIEAEGVFNGSGSDSHLASISTARAGGALKDVAAPCICAYIKAISIWSLMMAPTIFISPYMPFVIDCAVKRMAYESIFTCMDWNKAYWAVLPGLMLLAVTGIIYVLFWNRDGTAAPESPAVPKAPMAMSSMPPPIVTNPVMYGPPPFEYAQYTQEVGPVMMTAQPPYQSAGIRMTAAGVPPAEPMMAAPMRPQSGLGDFVQNGYVVEGYGGYRA
jgi:K(+)-stimulated pyrophosphate-energized sodium pump